MKWILENATKLIGLLSFSLIVFTTVHDWGYFSVIGPNYRTLLSAYDYITNAIEWMPAFAFWFTIAVTLSFVFVSLTSRVPEQGYGDHARKIYRRKLFQMSGLMLAGGLFLFCLSLFGTAPTSSAIRVLAAISVLNGLMGLYLSWKDTPFKVRRLMAMIIGGFILAAAAYTTGVEEARSAIQSPANVYNST